MTSEQHFVQVLNISDVDGVWRKVRQKNSNPQFFISTDFPCDNVTNITTKNDNILTIDNWKIIDKYTKGGAHAFGPFWPKRSNPWQCLSCCRGIFWSSILWWGNIMTLSIWLSIFHISHSLHFCFYSYCVSHGMDDIKT